MMFTKNLSMIALMAAVAVAQSAPAKPATASKKASYELGDSQAGKVHQSRFTDREPGGEDRKQAGRAGQEHRGQERACPAKGGHP